MTGLALSLALAASMVGEVKSYASAYASAQQTGKPMLVLIGAEWCPGCRTMKSQVMPRMSSAGKLKDVEFAVVDTDREDALSDKLLRGNLIPQLVLITKTADGGCLHMWRSSCSSQCAREAGLAPWRRAVPGRGMGPRTGPAPFHNRTLPSEVRSNVWETSSRL